MLLAKLSPIYDPALAPPVRDGLTADFVAADRLLFRVILAHWVMVSTLTAFKHGTYLLGFVGGGAVTAMVYFGLRAYAGQFLSRALTAAGLMLFSAIIIQQGLGRIEMHFHIFAALGMLLRYRDIAPLLVATVVIAVHHVALAVCQLQGVSLMGVELLAYGGGITLFIFSLHVAFVILSVAVGSVIVHDNTQRAIATLHGSDEMRQILESRELWRRLPDDAFGQVANPLLRSIEALFTATKKHSEVIAASVTRLSNSGTEAQQLAATSGERAQGVASTIAVINEQQQTMAAAVEELNVCITEVAREVRSTAHLIMEAALTARRSDELMTSLGERADEVGGVVEVIANIAEQTNLLALNATIEAARAGEAGRGFAVVASEVKNLADQTQTAASKVTELIAGIQNGAQEAIRSVSEIGDAMEQAQEASQTVAAATEEQAVTLTGLSSGVNQAATDFDAITRAIQSVTQDNERVASLVQDAHIATLEVERATADLAAEGVISAS